MKTKIKTKISKELIEDCEKDGEYCDTCECDELECLQNLLTLKLYNSQELILKKY